MYFRKGVQEETMEYVIQNVPYVAQDGVTTCWKASYKMMLKYRKLDVSAADNLPASQAMVREGIKDYQFETCRTKLGLTSTNYKCFNTADNIEYMLRMYGPVWVSGFYCNGAKHIVVLRGVKDPFVGSAEVLLNDPWRGYKSGVCEPKWYDLQWFVDKMNPVMYACQHWR